MQRNKQLLSSFSQAFTLVELLVVITIIGVLAGFLLPALKTAKDRAKVMRAKTEMNDFRTAIQNYYTDYGRFPSSTNAVDSVAGQSAGPSFIPACPDFTYGTLTNSSPTSVMRDKGNAPLPTISNVGNTSAGRPGYQANNSELVGILMNLTSFRSGIATVNQNFERNPRKIVYLNAKPAPDNFSGGIGTDGVYRDPWGKPYIVTLDLNYDNRARDAFYRNAAVTMPVAATNQLSPLGLVGLSRISTDPFFQPPGRNSALYEAAVQVTIWSFGIDGKINANIKADDGENRDNILSWQQ